MKKKAIMLYDSRSFCLYELCNCIVFDRLSSFVKSSNPYDFSKYSAGNCMFLKSFWGGKTLYILSHRISADTKMKNDKVQLDLYLCFNCS